MLFQKILLLVNCVQDRQDSVAGVTCDRDQSTEQLDQSQHEGDAKVPRQREEERIAVRCNRMLGETKANKYTGQISKIKVPFR